MFSSLTWYTLCQPSRWFERAPSGYEEGRVARCLEIDDRPLYCWFFSFFRILRARKKTKCEVQYFVRSVRVDETFHGSIVWRLCRGGFSPPFSRETSIVGTLCYSYPVFFFLHNAAFFCALLSDNLVWHWAFVFYILVWNGSEIGFHRWTCWYLCLGQAYVTFLSSPPLNQAAFTIRSSGKKKKIELNSLTNALEKKIPASHVRVCTPSYQHAECVDVST